MVVYSCVRLKKLSVIFKSPSYPPPSLPPLGEEKDNAFPNGGRKIFASLKSDFVKSCLTWRYRLA